MIKNKLLTILITFGTTLAFFTSAGSVEAVTGDLLGRVYKDSVGVTCTRPLYPILNNRYFLGTACDGTGLQGTTAECVGAPDYTITWDQPSTGKSGSLGANDCDNSDDSNYYYPRYVSWLTGNQPDSDPAGITTSITANTNDSRYKINYWYSQVSTGTNELPNFYLCHQGGNPNNPLQLIEGWPYPNQSQTVQVPLFAYDEYDPNTGITHRCDSNHINFGSLTDPRGNLDSATCSVTTGWACDPDDFNMPIRVDLYTINGSGNYAPLGSTNAGIDTGRADVANMCGGNKIHGFSFNIPNTSQDGTVNLKDGASHEIHAFGIDINAPPDGNKELTGSPRSITCPAPTLPPSPNLGTLIIDADISLGGTAGVTYGLSGLRKKSTEQDPGLLATQDGSNYYNALKIKQNINNPASAALMGTAFVSNTSSPTNLASLKTAADAANGFILIYANASKTAAGNSFTAGNYYAYFRGLWQGPITTYYESPGEIKIIPLGGGPGAPEFSVTFYKTLGTHTWKTYGYMMDNSTNAETAQPKTACNEAGTSCVP